VNSERPNDLDVAEITCNGFIEDLAVSSVGIRREEMPARRGYDRSRKVSMIEVKLVKT
jgi:DNA-binding protein